MRNLRHLKAFLIAIAITRLTVRCKFVFDSDAQMTSLQICRDGIGEALREEDAHGSALRRLAMSEVLSRNAHQSVAPGNAAALSSSDAAHLRDMVGNAHESQ